jgi:hypothetical protein
LYQQAKVHAARENRKMKDLITEGLQLVLGLSSGKPRRMMKAPVRIREGNSIPALSNDEIARLLEETGEQLP